MATFVDMDVRLVIGRLRPDSEYQWTGTKGDAGYNTLAECVSEWRDAVNAMPTESELLAAWDAYQIEQQQKQQADTDRENEVRALRLVDAALAQIAADRATLAADLAALPTATTADRWLIVGRALTILDRSLNRETSELKVLARLARRYLGEE
jgi:hypothetical protein